MNTALLRQLIREVVLAEKKRRHKKPGGPRSDIGAVRQLDPDAFVTKVKSAVDSHHGDVQGAADELGVAKRTAYYYLEDEPKLGDVETTEDVEDDSKR